MNEVLKSNEPSANLTNEENHLIFSLIGKQCQTQCTSVVQLYQTEAPYYRQWIKKHTGVLCFVKDNAKRSYYIRMFCLNKCELVYEQEIYDNIEISRLKSYLLTYEGQDGMVALNFAFQKEAELFLNISTSTIERRNQRKKERIAQKTSSSMNNVPKVSSFKKKKKFSKKDIGMPSNFIHVTGFGSNETNGCDLNDQYVSLRQTLIGAGVSESQLNDRKTIKLINKFLEKNNKPPPLPERNPNINRKKPLPPLPTDSSKSAIASSSIMKVSTSSISSSNTSAPPPPPPPPQVFCEISKPEMLSPHTYESLKQEQKLIPVNSDSRDELLKAIRHGTVLKAVNASAEIKPCEKSSGNETNILEALIIALKKKEPIIRGLSESDEDEDEDENNLDWDS